MSELPLLDRRRAYLDQLLKALPSDKADRGRVSPLDATWRDWLHRTGELPPDFDETPSIPFLPDPLVLDEGGENTPVATDEHWLEQRRSMRAQVKHWITGTFPPRPGNLEAKVLSEKPDGGVTSRVVELRFGPDHKARLTVELLIPPGDGPFPVFMTQWNHRGWALVAVRRGYIGCLYAGADSKDDTEDYADIWYPAFDFTCLTRRAWGAMRAIDYLETVPQVDRERIAITGHSRNGKQSLIAAAFDERIAAVVPSSGGTGAEDPFRYTSDKFDNETILQITTNFPHWLHPRLRFFIGREHKLPVDTTTLMALVAPRSLMLTSAITEGQGNPWGIEQAYRNASRVYAYFGASDRIAIRLRHGLHGTAARDIEAFVDFFDHVFGRSEIEPSRRLYYGYSFERWIELSGEDIEVADHPEQAPGEFLLDGDDEPLTLLEDWEERREQILAQLRWTLGDEPPGAANPGPSDLSDLKAGADDYLADVIGRPRVGDGIGARVIGPDTSFGDYLHGRLYYPVDDEGRPKGENLPVFIYLHEYAYPTGYGRNSLALISSLVKKGTAVLAFDQLGFGTRIEEGELFYERYPRWSKLGKMVADTRAAVTALSNLSLIDSERIGVGGYALGATVGLCAAALDTRVSSVVSVCGFTPLRTGMPAQGVEGLRAYSHLHGLAPRLGFFADHEARLPIDFDEILACVAPRRLLVVAPTWDRDAIPEDVAMAAGSTRRVYALHKAEASFMLVVPEGYNRLSSRIAQQVAGWLYNVTAANVSDADTLHD